MLAARKGRKEGVAKVDKKKGKKSFQRRLFLNESRNSTGTS